jgi:voltage-gated potassium channel
MTPARRIDWTTSASWSDGVWQLPVLVALVLTIPAFYVMMLPEPQLLWWARGAYALAGLVLGAPLWRTAAPQRSRRLRAVDAVLAIGLLLSAVLPSSLVVRPALGLRLAVALLTLMRLVWSLQHLLTRRSLAYLLLLALTVLALCGVGFWWLEPTAHTLDDGLWLAFTTAATVGYGDLVPTTAASRIFSVFVVLLGYAVLSLVTAAIAAMWVETEERRMEHELLRAMHKDLRAQLSDVRAELDALRQLALAAQPPAPPADTLRAPAGATAASAAPQRSTHPPSRSAGS